MIKGARRLLLKSRDTLTARQAVELDELLTANHSLFVVTVLRDALKDLWQQRHPEQAAHRLTQLVSQSPAQPHQPGGAL